MSHRPADISVPIRVLPHGEGLPLPSYATAHAAGLDLMAAIDVPLEMLPGARLVVPTGISIALPEGYEGQVRPRSGLARKHGITLLNAPGTIDADYRGEVQVILINLSPDAFTVARGERIAQLIVAPVARIAWARAEALSETARGTGGFGSTGRKALAP
jgi:dUTP pyrophosphatase